MRFSTLAAAALAAGPMAVSAGRLGFSLGVKNPDGTCKQQSDFEQDFDTLKDLTTVVRTYSASDCDNPKALLPAAKAKGFKVILAVWPDTPDSFNKDREALQASVHGNEDVIEAITVGSEALYRGTMDANALLDSIKTISEDFPGVAIGTADSWNKFADGTADPLIIGKDGFQVNHFLVNAFAFWQGTEVSEASHTLFDDVQQATDRIHKTAGDRAGDIYIAVGETGWPSDGGSNYEAAIAGTDNAKVFHDEALCAILDWGVDAFYFEAFDEPWKPKTTGDNGEEKDETHWGMFTADRQPKFEAGCPNKQ